jgi:hypothetical protein
MFESFTMDVVILNDGGYNPVATAKNLTSEPIITSGPFAGLTASQAQAAQAALAAGGGLSGTQGQKPTVSTTKAGSGVQLLTVSTILTGKVIIDGISGVFKSIGDAVTSKSTPTFSVGGSSQLRTASTPETKIEDPVVNQSGGFNFLTDGAYKPKKDDIPNLIGNFVEKINENAEPKEVRDTTPPVIEGLSVIIITVGQSLPNLLAGVTAFDVTDGDVTSSISVSNPSNIGSTSVAGTYSLFYTAIDDAGNLKRESRLVVVKEVSSADITAPVITYPTSTFRISLNQSFSSEELLSGVSATDNVDGPVTVVANSNINPTVVGFYTITYKASDKAGNISTKDRKAEVTGPESNVSVFTPEKVITVPAPNPGDPLYIYLKKIRNQISTLSLKDVEDMFIKILSPDEFDLISVVFSLERTHFLAIVFLLFLGRINAEDIKRMVRMTYYNRGEAIINFLQKDRDELYIFRNFMSIMNSKFNNLEGRYPERIQSLNDMLVKNTSAQVSDNIITHTSAIITSQEAINPFAKLNLSANRDYRYLLRRLSYRIRDRGKAAELINQLLLENRNKTLDKKSFFSTILSKNFPSFIYRHYQNRLFYRWRKLSDSIDIITEPEITAAVQEAVKEVYENENVTPQPTDLDYFKYLYNIYNGDTTFPSEISGIYTFDYVENEYVKDLLNSIFPEDSAFSISKSSPKYLAKYFLSFDSDKGRSDEKSFFNVNGSFIRPLLTGLLENDLLVDDSRNVLSFGSYNKTSFISDSFIDAIDDIIANNTTLSLLKLEDIPTKTYSSVVSYTDSLKDAVKESISSSTYGSVSQRIFNVFFNDIFDQYMAYLVNGKDEDFEVKLSAETFKVYKLLSFIQQTFINIIGIVDKIENNEAYQTFSNTLVLFNSSDYTEAFLDYLGGE